MSQQLELFPQTKYKNKSPESLGEAFEQLNIAFEGFIHVTKHEMCKSLNKTTNTLEGWIEKIDKR